MSDSLDWDRTEEDVLWKYLANLCSDMPRPFGNLVMAWARLRGWAVPLEDAILKLKVYGVFTVIVLETVRLALVEVLEDPLWCFGRRWRWLGFQNPWESASADAYNKHRAWLYERVRALSESARVELLGYEFAAELGFVSPLTKQQEAQLKFKADLTEAELQTWFQLDMLAMKGGLGEDRTKGFASEEVTDELNPTEVDANGVGVLTSWSLEARWERRIKAYQARVAAGRTPFVDRLYFMLSALMDVVESKKVLLCLFGGQEGRTQWEMTLVKAKSMITEAHLKVLVKGQKELLAMLAEQLGGRGV